MEEDVNGGGSACVKEETNLRGGGCGIECRWEWHRYLRTEGWVRVQV